MHATSHSPGCCWLGAGCCWVLLARVWGACAAIHALSHVGQDACDACHVPCPGCCLLGAAGCSCWVVLGAAGGAGCCWLGARLLAGCWVLLVLLGPLRFRGCSWGGRADIKSNNPHLTLVIFSVVCPTYPPNHTPESYSRIIHYYFRVWALQTRRRMARERRGAGSSLVSMETQF